MIRTAFLGTPPPAVPSLDLLARSTDLRLAITRPDRPRGRGRTPAMPPVKRRAQELGIPVHQPRTADRLGALLASRDLDLAVVVAFGMLLTPETISYPRWGTWNLHFSLLPRWRGAAPVQRAILAGDETTGVTLMQMAAGLDSGGVLAAWETSIGSDETAGELTDRLATAAAELLARSLESLGAEELSPLAQDERKVTWAPRFTAAEARLDFTRSAVELERAIRAFSPWPGAHTTWRGRRFKIHRARMVPGELEPGVLDTGLAGLRVGTAAGCLELLSVQPEGTRAMEARQWLRGVRGDLGRLE